VEITLQSQMQATELQEQNVHLKKAATTDGLTGLYNRAHFDQFMAEQFAIAQREKKLLSLLLLDVDKFKSINDKHGHPAGDAGASASGQAAEVRGPRRRMWRRAMAVRNFAWCWWEHQGDRRHRCREHPPGDRRATDPRRPGDAAGDRQHRCRQLRTGIAVPRSKPSCSRRRTWRCMRQKNRGETA
jgi:hypothetical protein